MIFILDGWKIFLRCCKAKLSFNPMAVMCTNDLSEVFNRIMEYYGDSPKTHQKCPHFGNRKKADAFSMTVKDNLFVRLKAMATSMKDLVGDPLDDFAKKFTDEFIELGIRWRRPCPPTKICHGREFGANIHFFQPKYVFKTKLKLDWCGCMWKPENPTTNDYDLLPPRSPISK